MRQTAQSVREAAAFHIHQHEVQLFGAVFHTAADNIRNQRFRFTRTRSTCDKSVRTVTVLVHIEICDTMLILAYRHTQPLSYVSLG